MGIEVRFWGVRGSIASPGAETSGVGGNTSCVEVVADGTRIVLDAGTGIRRLGEQLLRSGGTTELAILLSHLHWDHIQGLPFFLPAYVATSELAIFGQAPLGAALAQQMREPVFPVRLDELAAKLALREVKPGDAFHVGAARVRVAKQNHPGGSLAYRLEIGEHVIVYATDTEHFSCVDPGLRALAEGADVLSYDSQYTPDEYAGAVGRPKVGWGHSTYVAGAQLAKAAGVGTYVLFHHDPQRTDVAVAELEREARALFAGAVAAREGLVLTLGEGTARRAA